MPHPHAHDRTICGHIATGFDGGGFTCYLRPGHEGWHEESQRLRDGSMAATNWGDDGLAIHASHDETRRRSEKVATMREP